MIPDTIVQWHAALNDFPSILFLVAALFGVLGLLTRRDSLLAAGFWVFLTGAAGAVLALLTGLRAEESFVHGAATHAVLEQHETFAIVATALVVVLAAWLVWRRKRMAGAERSVLVAAAAVVAGVLLWTAHLGGTIVYEHGGGIPTAVLQRAVSERASGDASGNEHERPEAEHEDVADSAASHERPTSTAPTRPD